MFRTVLALALCFSLTNPVSALVASPSVAPSSDPWIQPELRVASQDPTSVLTILLGFDAARAEEALEGLRMRGFLPMGYEHLPVAVLTLRAVDVPRALETPGVVSAAMSGTMAPQVEPRGEAGNFGGTGDEMTRADRARALGVTGRGVGLAMIDLGVSGLHPGLKPRAEGGPLVQNVKVIVSPGKPHRQHDIESPVTVYVENLTNSDLTDGHGTHTAGIAVGAWTPDGLLGGRAPGADLIALGAGDLLALPWILGGLEWVIAHKDAYNIRILSNSWGLEGPYEPLHPVNLATKAVHEAGVLVIFSAGNFGPGLRTMNAYAQAPHVLAVGSTTLSGSMARSSSRGDPAAGKPGPEIVAPGSDIISARNQMLSGNDVTLRTPWTDGAYIPAEHLLWYRAVSGTSMAAPQVAGIAALVLEADPSLSRDGLRDILLATARPLMGYEYAAQGHGMVDAEAAVLAALGLPVPPRDVVEPTVVLADDDAVTYPFHGSILAGPEKSQSAFRTRHGIPIRLPSLGATISYAWDVVPVGTPASGHAVSVYGADGTLVARRALDAGNGSIDIALDAATLATHKEPAWSAAHWTLQVDVDAGALAYDVAARVEYAGGDLPPITHVAPPPPPPLPAREPHGPIVIADDAGFTSANGVVSGTGAPDDPFIIEGWDIQPGSGTGITIGGRIGTTMHVVVRNVHVASTRGDCALLQNAAHVTVQDSDFDGCLGSFNLIGAKDTIIERNSFTSVGRGPSVFGAQGLVIRDNELTDVADWGILLSQGINQGGGPTQGVIVERNTLSGDKTSIMLTTPGELQGVVRDNAFTRGAPLEIANGAWLSRVSGSDWLDGKPLIRQIAGTGDSPVPWLNTIVDAGSDRAAAPGAIVCLADARADLGPHDTFVALAWDLGQGSTSAEVRPCRVFPPGETLVTLVVTVQGAGEQPVSLRDTARVVVG